MFYEVATYSPEEVILSFGGHIVIGWDSIVLRKTSPSFKTVKGIRGKNTRIRNRDSHAIIEVVCHQTSLTNQILSAISSLDLRTGGARMEVMLSDKSGFEVFSSEEAFVQNEADREYTAQVADRKWTIECLTSRFSDVGSSFSQGSIFSTLGGMFN